VELGAEIILVMYVTFTCSDRFEMRVYAWC